MVMADTPRENETKYNRFLNSIRTLAPDKTFGGVTLANLETQVGNSNVPRERLAQLDDRTRHEEATRNTADAVTMRMCEMIKNGVGADPEFGDDSALYEALGFVRKSARKSSLTRKKPARV
jgi:hypothetical protein